MWRLAAARLARLSCALVAEVQAEATLMLGTRSRETFSLVDPPAGQLFNPQQEIICDMPSAPEIWGRADTGAWCQEMHHRWILTNQSYVDQTIRQ